MANKNAQATGKSNDETIFSMKDATNAINMKRPFKFEFCVRSHNELITF